MPPTLPVRRPQAAANNLASIDEKTKKPFSYASPGSMGARGRRSAVGQVMVMRVLNKSSKDEWKRIVQDETNGGIIAEKRFYPFTSR